MALNRVSEKSEQPVLVPAEPVENNKARELVTKSQVKAAEKSPKAKREQWAAKAKETEIKEGEDVASTAAGVGSTVGTVAAVAGVVAAAANVVPIFGQIVSACAAIVGAVCTGIAIAGKDQASKAKGEKDLHMNEASQAANQGIEAGKKIDGLSKKNLAQAEGQRLDALKGKIADQKERIGTLDPKANPKGYEKAQDELRRMETDWEKTSARKAKYEASASGQKTSEATRAVPTVSDPNLPMTARSSAEVVNSESGAAELGSNQADVSTTAGSTSTVSSPATTAQPTAG